MSGTDKSLSVNQQMELLDILHKRFEENMHRHGNLKWSKVETRLKTHVDSLWSLFEMERTGGEPDVVGCDVQTEEYTFYDCAPESPEGRRSICYDLNALESRKKNHPKHNAIDMATEMGIELLTEEQYRDLQTIETVDQKTSSWLKTPFEVRKRGGALFGDFRYGRVFIYHNGAQSYYGARGFRGVLKV